MSEEGELGKRIPVSRDSFVPGAFISVILIECDWQCGSFCMSRNMPSPFARLSKNEALRNKRRARVCACHSSSGTLRNHPQAMNLPGVPPDFQLPEDPGERLAWMKN